MNSLEQESKVIDFIRFPLIVLVILMHTITQPTWGLDTPLDATMGLHGLNIFMEFRLIIRNIMGHVAVPLFFLISGYLFYKPNELNSWNVYQKKIRKRFLSILVPYLFFNFIKFIEYCINDTKGVDEFLGYVGNHFSFHIFWDYILGENSWAAPICGPLWYLRELFIMFLIAPLLRMLLERCGLVILIILLCIFFVPVFPYIEGLYILSWLFFSLGLYLRVKRWSILQCCQKGKSICYWCCLACFLLSIYCFGTSSFFYVRNCFIIMGVISFVNCSSYFIERFGIVPNKTLSNSTFFIYCLHTIFISTVSIKIIDFLLNPMSEYWTVAIARYLLSGLLTVLLCLGIYWIVIKYLPILNRSLLGGR